VREIALADGERTAGNGTPFTNFCPGTWISTKAVPMFCFSQSPTTVRISVGLYSQIPP